MDPYRNWSSGASLEDSDSSPPTYGVRGSQQGQTRASLQSAASSKGKKDADDYDFDISQGSDDEVVKPSRASSSQANNSRRASTGAVPSSSRAGGAPQGRLSMEERMQEILKRNQVRSSVASSPEPSPTPSPKGVGGGAAAKTDWKRSFDDLMDMNADLDVTATSRNDTNVSPLSPSGGPTSPKYNAKAESGDSSYGDSLEITAADLEVGEYAARRLKEKTQDRQARMALSVAPHTLVNKTQPARGVPQAKVAASPDVTNKGRVRDATIRGGFQISAALSSINRSRDDDFSDDEEDVMGGGSNRAGMQRYGSLEKSDERVYKMLSATGAAAGASASASTGEKPKGKDDEDDEEEDDEDEEEEDEDEGDEDDDDDGSGDSELAQSREMDGRFAKAPQDLDESEEEEEEAEAPEAAAPAETTAEERERKYAEIRQRWLGADDKKAEATEATAVAAAAADEAAAAASASAAAAAAVAHVPIPTPAPHALAPEAEAQLLPGMRLLTAIGSASMVTSVPPPAPPLMSASAELAVTTYAPDRESVLMSSAVMDFGASASATYSDRSQDSSMLHGADIEPPAPPYSASMALEAFADHEAEDVPAPLSVEGREGRASLRYSSALADEDQDRDASMLEGEGFELPSAPAAAAAPAPVLTTPAVQAPDPAPAPAVHIVDETPPPPPPPSSSIRAPTVDDLVPSRATKTVVYSRPQSGANVTAGQHNIGVDTHGRTVLASQGQAALSKIVAFEIDPASLGLPPPPTGLGSVAASVSVKSRTHSSPMRVPAASTSWPEGLPLTAPSASELHAHIAMMETSQKRRIAAATAAKIKSFRQGGGQNVSADDAHGDAKKPTRKTVKRAVGPAPALPSAVNRLEQGTARLARQYEQLQQEMQSLKSGQAPGGVHRGVQASATASRSLGGAAAAAPSQSPPRPHAHHSPQRPAPARPARSAAQPTSIDADIDADPSPSFAADDGELWQSVAMQTMKKIVAEGDRLEDRERDLQQREEALRLRQSITEAGTYAALAEAVMQPRSSATLTAAPVALPRAREDEFLDLQRSEARAQAEVDRLKALLFELQNDAPADTSQPIRPPRRTHYSSSSSSSSSAAAASKGPERGAEEGQGDSKSDKGDTVTLLKSEYDALLQELASQETLIAGFQRENEKLVSQLRTRESEEASKKAHFFDRQETLNKELNRLRNAAGGEGLAEGGPSVRKSADMLRAELDADAQVRALKERLALAESGAGVREKEMQQTIDKLRKENRGLAAASAKVSPGVFSGQDEDHAAMAEQRRVHDDELKALRTKLAWYAENQQLLETAEKDRAEALGLASALKKELRRRGVDAKTVAAIKPGSPEAEPKADLDASGISSSKRTSARSPSDVKKIRELEETVTELQECLRKRHPDSISSLVRAAAVSDSVQLERRGQEEHMASMARELEEAKAGFELRLRSIRQEHERLEVGYKARIAALESAGPASPHLATPLRARDASPGAKEGRFTGPVKTLPQAQARIRELEEETERIRAFYTKKVEEVSRRAETQMRALKRGSPTEDDAAPQPPATPATPADGWSDPGGQWPGQGPSAAAVRLEYEERLRMMEAELVRTAEELGAAKTAAAASASAAGAAAGAAVGGGGGAREGSGAYVSLEVVRGHPQWEREVEREVEARVTKLRLAEMERRLEAGRGEGGERERERERGDGGRWAEERERLQARVREEEARAAGLGDEVARLRRQAHEQATSPQATQLQALESQLVHLETRLQRRERETAQAAEEGRAASKLERARLEGLHRAELAEKDEQLVRFQQELEQLVYALRQWQFASSSPEGPAPSPALYHPPPSLSSSVFV